MQRFPATTILRHRRENLKKCSLRGLESHPDMRFYSYPMKDLPNLSGYLLLTLDAEPLSLNDAASGLLLIDGTWRYAEKMMKFVDGQINLERRSIPKGFQTAYPRRQEDCPDPDAGLASVEALFIAYAILGRESGGLLDRYYWKEAFLENNRDLLGFYHREH